MSFEIPNMTPAIPEVFLLGMTCTILIVDLFLSDRSRIVTYLLTQLSLLGTMFLTINSEAYHVNSYIDFVIVCLYPYLLRRWGVA